MSEQARAQGYEQSRDRVRARGETFGGGWGRWGRTAGLVSAVTTLPRRYGCI